MGLFDKRKRSKRKKLLAKSDANLQDNDWTEIPDPDPELKEKDDENILLEDLEIKFQAPFNSTPFKLKMEQWGQKLSAGMKTEIFRKTSILLISFALMGAGFYGSRKHYQNVLYDLAMSVSAIDKTERFSLSNTEITVKQQYRDKDTYLIPFNIASFDKLSPEAKDFEVVIQGKTMDIDPDTRAKIILYGDSGDGAILIEGKFTGEPMNIYFQSNNSIIGDIDGDFTEVSAQDFEKSILKGDFYLLDSLAEDPTESGDRVYVGTVQVNGYDVDVAQDLVVFSLNPLADNVRVVDNLYFDMPYDELYSNVLSLAERDSIALNLKNADEKKEEVIEVMRQYEERLKTDINYTDSQVSTVLQVDNYAIDAIGSTTDIKFINTLLAGAGIDELSNARAVSDDFSSEMSDEDYQNAIREEAERLNNYTSSDASTDILELLDQARNALMSINRQMMLYEYRSEYIDEQAEELKNVVTSVESYTLVRPYTKLKNK